MEGQDFRVSSEIFEIFDENISTEKREQLKKRFPEFRVSHDIQSEYAYKISKTKTVEMDEHQIILWGADDEGVTAISYMTFEDDEESEDYKNAMNLLEVIKRDYKIED